MVLFGIPSNLTFCDIKGLDLTDQFGKYYCFSQGKVIVQYVLMNSLVAMQVIYSYGINFSEDSFLASALLILSMVDMKVSVYFSNWEFLKMDK